MSFSHAALDWNAPGDAGPDLPPGPVDVVVPVYGAAAELAACLASLLRHTDLDRHRLVLVIDGPQGADVEAALAAMAAVAGRAEAAVLVLRNPERLGFVGSVNRGMALSQRDVTLLNSDTEVTAGWLAKLQEAAASHPAIATVTPFSNHATIASLPRSAEVNALPAGWSLDRFAALVERAAARERPRLPTGVGVCLYIKRRALDRLGFFDEERFGLGYGEESEFCFRALKAGYLNVLDDATFIYHAGQRSFGAARPERVRAAHRALGRLHPEYLPTVARFLRADPLRPARERVLAGLRPGARSRTRAPRKVLHLVHGWPPWNPAGTEVYARRLALRQAGWREVTVYARMAAPDRELGEALEIEDGGARVRLVVNNFTQRDPLSRNALHDRRLAADFRALLDAERPDLLHVHHLAGHAATLPGLAARRRIPILFQIQDWWAPCARANLLDAGRHLCSGPAPARCSACLPLTGLPPAPLLNRALHAARARLTRRALRHADAFVMGSHAIERSFRELGWLRPGDRAFVIPYGIERPSAGTGSERALRPPRPPGSPLRFGVIGSLLPHKGIHLAVAAFRGVDPARATLQVWGDPAVSPAYSAEIAALASPAVRLAGRFAEAERGGIFAGLDVLIVPSLGLESFGLVAREALAEGVPVLAARRGALAELFDPAAGPPCGALFDPESPAELSGWIARLAAAPEIAAAWAAAPPPVKEMDEHAEEIERVYAEILAARGKTA